MHYGPNWAHNPSRNVWAKSVLKRGNTLRTVTLTILLKIRSYKTCNIVIKKIYETGDLMRLFGKPTKEVQRETRLKTGL